MNTLNELEYFIFKSTPLRWNRFKNKKYPTIYCFCFTVKIDSPIFILKQFGQSYETRFEMIMNLDRQGFSTIEIRDFLNSNNIRPPRTDIYSTQLVWVTVRKLRQRESKKQLTHRHISDVSVEIGYLSFKD